MSVGKLFAINHNLYVELFSGEYTKLLKRTPDVSEVYNDTNNEFVDFFKWLRVDFDRFSEYLNGNDVDGIDEDTESKWKKHKKRVDFFREDMLRYSLSNFTGYRGISRELRKELSKGNNFLEFLVSRLRMIQFEKRRFDDLLERFDGKQTLFYADLTGKPEDVDDREIVDLLLKVKGHCIVYGDTNEKYDRLIDEGWFKYVLEEKEYWLNFKV